jgi:hypothetical protein
MVGRARTAAYNTNRISDLLAFPRLLSSTYVAGLLPAAACRSVACRSTAGLCQVMTDMPTDVLLHAGCGQERFHALATIRDTCGMSAALTAAIRVGMHSAVHTATHAGILYGAFFRLFTHDKIEKPVSPGEWPSLRSQPVVRNTAHRYHLTLCLSAELLLDFR